MNLHTHASSHSRVFFAQPLSPVSIVSLSLVNGELRLETPFGRTRTRGLPSDQGTRELSSIPFAPFFSVSSRVIFFREKENKLLRLFFSSPPLLLSSVPSKSLWRQGARFCVCVEGEKTFFWRRTCQSVDRSLFQHILGRKRKSRAKNKAQFTVNVIGVPIISKMFLAKEKEVDLFCVRSLQRPRSRKICRF